jgi:hypothetical protein
MIFADNHSVEDVLAVVATEEVEWLSWARANGFIVEESN